MIITLAVQQRQIRKQEEAERRHRQKEERAQYEDVLFRLLEIYRQTLSEVRVGKVVGRDVLRNCLVRVDKGLKEDGSHCYPKELEARLLNKRATEADHHRADYYHFRNFKIIAAEINPQGRLLDTFEVLLEHLVYGAPDHLLIDTYKDLVFAQITYLECRYYFLVALGLTHRTKLRDLLDRSGFLGKVPRSNLHKIHKLMYEEYWGVEIPERQIPPAMPLTRGRLKRAFRAHKDATGDFSKTYIPLEVRRSLASNQAQVKDEQ